MHIDTRDVLQGCLVFPRLSMTGSWLLLPGDQTLGRRLPDTFRQLAVQGCVMSDDNSCIGDESRERIAVDFMAGRHFVGNAVKLDVLGTLPPG
jgi:hypothetical protein